MPGDSTARWCKNLSGGNQQKVVIGKWLLRGPRIFILDEPTRGIDVGAKYEVYKIINQLAADGPAILMISSEIEELIGMCDRIMVMGHGEIRGVFDRADFERETIMRAAHVGRRQGSGSMTARPPTALRCCCCSTRRCCCSRCSSSSSASLSDRFLTPGNFLNIVTQATHIAIIAIGMTFVLLVARRSTCRSASIMYLRRASCVALYLGLELPLFVFFRSILAGRPRLRRGQCLRSSPICGSPAFIATLATLFIGRGLALYFSETKMVFGRASRADARPLVGMLGVPWAIWIFLLVVAAWPGWC